MSDREKDARETSGREKAASEQTDVREEIEFSDAKASPRGSGPEQSGVEQRIRAVRGSAPFRMWDLLVYGFLLLAIVGVLLAVFLPDSAVTDAARLEVFVGGKKTAEYALSDDGEYEVKSGDTVLLVLVVREREAYVQASVCDDHLCERMKIVGRSRQIICLPNKVVVQLTDGIGGQDNVPGGVV